MEEDASEQKPGEVATEEDTVIAGDKNGGVSDRPVCIAGKEWCLLPPADAFGLTNSNLCFNQL